MAILLVPAAFLLHGQTTVSPTNAPPQLSPPYGELPPTFWEQHGIFIVVAGLGLIALVTFGTWRFVRPRPKIVVPPEVEAREALENLRQQPEDGVIVSRVTQVVRNYFIAAFQLSPGEFTTVEFSRELASSGKINSELSILAAEFLYDCDARKFSATSGSTKLDAANRAMILVEQAEQRRAQLRQPVGTQTENPRE